MTQSHVPIGRPSTRPGRALRSVLWLLLVGAVVGNTVASVAGAALVANLAFGAVGAVAMALLVVHHVRGPRSSTGLRS